MALALRRDPLTSTIAPVPTIISEFVKTYEKKWKKYKDIAESAKGICESFINGSSYMAIITSRAKDPGSLQKKLIRENENERRPGGFQSKDEIKEYIWDLSGVRIQLYYPNHKEAVKELLENQFVIERTIEHPRNDQQSMSEPYSNRFKGYQATHLRVRLRKEKETGRVLRAKDKIEIQVMSVLQSAWSEVEHNIVYKQLVGKPSFQERQMLDGFNGLVAIGELYLEQLDSVYKSRLINDKRKDDSFANRYELGAFLWSELSQITGPGVERFTLASVELLRRFLELESVGLDTQAKLSGRLMELNLNGSLTTSFETRTEKPNVSLVIMDRLYGDLSAELKQQSPTDEIQRCRTMMSTILSLDELFPPISYWEAELSKDPSDQEDIDLEPVELARDDIFENLKWLIHDSMPRMILSNLAKPGELERAKLENLWFWFKHHQSDIVRFVFGISRLGVVRDLPQEIPALEKIYRMIEPVL